MKYKLTLLILMILSFTSLTFAQAPLMRPVLLQTTFPGKNINLIEIAPNAREVLFAEANNRVYLSPDFGKSWREIFRLPGVGGDITFIEPSEFSEELWIGTTEGLFKYDRKWNQTEKLFSSPQKNENHIQTIAANPYNAKEIFIGTTRGLFTSRDGGRHWFKSPFINVHETVFDLEFHPNMPSALFVLTEKGFYHIDLLKNSVGKVYQPSAFVPESGATADFTPSENAVELSTNTLFKFTFSLNRDEAIYLSNQDGFFKTENLGKSWQPLHENALQSGLLDFLIHSNDESLFFLNENGVYKMDENQNTQKILSIRSLGYGNLAHFESPFLGAGSSSLGGVTPPLQNNPHKYVGAGLPGPQTDRFLFNMGHHLYYWEGAQSVMQNNVEQPFQPIQFFSPFMPDVRELQQAALEYNRLTTDRMKSWERRARLRGLVPSVGFDVEKSIGNNIDIDRGSTSEPDIFLDGPNEKSWDFGFGVEWDLANLFWNDDETSIEIRARALVDQREEILNEVTRLYFEWVRLKNAFDYDANAEKQIRAEEVRALLDGLTGGYITK